jgi:hypothetical protein
MIKILKNTIIKIIINEINNDKNTLKNNNNVDR